MTRHLFCLLPLFVIVSEAASAEFVNIGSFRTDVFSPKLSGNGEFVVGTSPTSEAIRWTRNDGLQTLAVDRRPLDISADGSVVVGVTVGGSIFADPSEPFMWTDSNGIEDLGRPDGFNSSTAAFAVSNDGTTIVGEANVIPPAGNFLDRITEPIRWTHEAGLSNLGAPDGMFGASARDVSADGRVIVGVAYHDSWHDLENWNAFIWDDVDGYQQIGPLPSHWTNAAAYRVSADGKTVVGSSASSGDVADQLFRWSSSDGFQEISILDGWDRGAVTAVSADGAVVIGGVVDANRSRLTPFVWDVKAGVRRLEDVLSENHDFSVDERLRNSVVTDISLDSTVIVGKTDTSDPFIKDFWAIYLDKPLVSPLGDLNDDHYRDITDIDVLSQAIRDSISEDRFDLNMDGVVNDADRMELIHQIEETFFGDANLDGEFNSGDLVAVFEAGQYEDDIVGNSTWNTGDWSGDGEFGTPDLVLAFQDGGYERGPRNATNAVPEPNAAWLLFSGTMLFATRRRST